MAHLLLGIEEQSGESAIDKLIVPAYTYTTSEPVVCHVGAKLVLIDSQEDSLEIDYNAVKSANQWEYKSKHLRGSWKITCDYARIFKIVEKRKAFFKPSNNTQKAIGRVVICTDAAHAFGVS